jgi:assimilatory nitrate reductase catalytic subunit
MRRFRFENDGQRAFDIGGLADLSREAWDALAPVRWPVSRRAWCLHRAGIAMANCAWCR